MTTKADQRVSETPMTPTGATPTLYIWLMDILNEYALPGGKFDGHSLITDLVTAKRFRAGANALKSDLAAARRDLKEALGYAIHLGRCFATAGECSCGLDALLAKLDSEEGE